MALTKCSECSREVSDKAGTCPGCGAPIAAKSAAGPKRKSGCLTWAVAGIIGFGVLSAIVAQCSGDSTSSSNTASSPKSSSSPSKPAIDKSPEKEKEREKLINDLQQRGVLGKVECRGSGATAIVGRSFYPLDFDTKQSFVGVVYAYCFDGTKDYVSIQLRDISTNKKVGEFSKEFGLKLD